MSRPTNAARTRSTRRTVNRRRRPTASPTSTVPGASPATTASEPGEGGAESIKGPLPTEEHERFEQGRPDRPAGDRDSHGRLVLVQLEALRLTGRVQRVLQRWGLPRRGLVCRDRPLQDVARAALHRPGPRAVVDLRRVEEQEVDV